MVKNSSKERVAEEERARGNNWSRWLFVNEAHHSVSADHPNTLLLHCCVERGALTQVVPRRRQDMKRRCLTHRRSKSTPAVQIPTPTLIQALLAAEAVEQHVRGARQRTPSTRAAPKSMPLVLPLMSVHMQHVPARLPLQHRSGTVQASRVPEATVQRHPKVSVAEGGGLLPR